MSTNTCGPLVHYIVCRKAGALRGSGATREENTLVLNELDDATWQRNSEHGVDLSWSIHVNTFDMFGRRRYKIPNRTLLLKLTVGFCNLVNILQLQVNLPKFAVIDSPFVRGILGDLFPEVRLADGNRKTLKPKHAVGHVCHYFRTVNPSFQCFMRVHCT